MRSFIFVMVVAAGFGGLGCPSSKPAEESAPRERPVDPNAPINLEKPDLARVQIDLAAIRAAVKRSKQIEGHTPASIEALQLKLSYPADLRYDAKTGEVKSRSYPRL